MCTLFPIIGLPRLFSTSVNKNIGCQNLLKIKLQKLRDSYFNFTLIRETLDWSLIFFLAEVFLLFFFFIALTKYIAAILFTLRNENDLFLNIL